MDKAARMLQGRCEAQAFVSSAIWGSGDPLMKQQLSFN
jgi:hypothetical protein